MTAPPRNSRFRLKARPDFWAHVFDSQGHGRIGVGALVLGSTVYSAIIWMFDHFTPEESPVGIPVAPYEVAGGVLIALLALRINAGHDRWWEARKLWGGITNQCRNLAITALANGPADLGWRRDLAAWTVAFAHVARRDLRNQRAAPELIPLIGAEAADRLTSADHMPTAAAFRLDEILRDARDRDSLDRFAYLQIEAQRNLLIDHLGGCERILKTPLAPAYVVLVRRFILMFILFLPFVLIPQLGGRPLSWLAIPFTPLILYPILALDRISDDLQHPFSVRSINHLPLDDITATIERNLLALLDTPAPAGAIDGDLTARLGRG